MKHKTGSKKVAAVLLSVALLLSCIPATALAAETGQDAGQQTAGTSSESASGETTSENFESAEASSDAGSTETADESPETQVSGDQDDAETITSDTGDASSANQMVTGNEALSSETAGASKQVLASGSSATETVTQDEQENEESVLSTGDADGALTELNGESVYLLYTDDQTGQMIQSNGKSYYYGFVPKNDGECEYTFYLSGGRLSSGRFYLLDSSGNQINDPEKYGQTCADYPGSLTCSLKKNEPVYLCVSCNSNDGSKSHVKVKEKTEPAVVTIEDVQADQTSYAYGADMRLRIKLDRADFNQVIASVGNDSHYTTNTYSLPQEADSDGYYTLTWQNFDLSGDVYLKEISVFDQYGYQLNLSIPEQYMSTPVFTISELQSELNQLSADGGGTYKCGSYTVRSDETLTIPENVTLEISNLGVNGSLQVAGRILVYNFYAYSSAAVTIGDDGTVAIQSNYYDYAGTGLNHVTGYYGAHYYDCSDSYDSDAKSEWRHGKWRTPLSKRGYIPENDEITVIDPETFSEDNPFEESGTSEEPLQDTHWYSYTPASDCIVTITGSIRDASWGELYGQTVENEEDGLISIDNRYLSGTGSEQFTVALPAGQTYYFHIDAWGEKVPYTFRAKLQESVLTAGQVADVLDFANATYEILDPSGALKTRTVTVTIPVKSGNTENSAAVAQLADLNIWDLYYSNQEGKSMWLYGELDQTGENLVLSNSRDLYSFTNEQLDYQAICLDFYYNDCRYCIYNENQASSKYRIDTSYVDFGNGIDPVTASDCKVTADPMTLNQEIVLTPGEAGLYYFTAVEKGTYTVYLTDSNASMEITSEVGTDEEGEYINHYYECNYSNSCVLDLEDGDTVYVAASVYNYYDEDALDRPVSLGITADTSELSVKSVNLHTTETAVSQNVTMDISCEGDLAEGGFRSVSANYSTGSYEGSGEYSTELSYSSESRGNIASSAVMAGRFYHPGTYHLESLCVRDYYGRSHYYYDGDIDGIDFSDYTIHVESVDDYLTEQLAAGVTQISLGEWYTSDSYEYGITVPEGMTLTIDYLGMDAVNNNPKPFVVNGALVIKNGWVRSDDLAALFVKGENGVIRIQERLDCNPIDQVIANAGDPIFAGTDANSELYGYVEDEDSWVHYHWKSGKWKKDRSDSWVDLDEMTELTPNTDGSIKWNTDESAESGSRWFTFRVKESGFYRVNITNLSLYDLAVAVEKENDTDEDTYTNISDFWIEGDTSYYLSAGEQLVVRAYVYEDETGSFSFIPASESIMTAQDIADEIDVDQIVIDKEISDDNAYATVHMTVPFKNADNTAAKWQADYEQETGDNPTYSVRLERSEKGDVDLNGSYDASAHAILFEGTVPLAGYDDCILYLNYFSFSKYTGDEWEYYTIYNKNEGAGSPLSHAAGRGYIQASGLEVSLPGSPERTIDSQTGALTGYVNTGDVYYTFTPSESGYYYLTTEAENLEYGCGGFYHLVQTDDDSYYDYDNYSDGGCELTAGETYRIWISIYNSWEGNYPAGTPIAMKMVADKTEVTLASVTLPEKAYTRFAPNARVGVNVTGGEISSGYLYFRKNSYEDDGETYWEDGFSVYLSARESIDLLATGAVVKYDEDWAVDPSSGEYELYQICLRDEAGKEFIFDASDIANAANRQTMNVISLDEAESGETIEVPAIMAGWDEPAVVIPAGLTINTNSVRIYDGGLVVKGTLHVNGVLRSYPGNIRVENGASLIVDELQLRDYCSLEIADGATVQVKRLITGDADVSSDVWETCRNRITGEAGAMMYPLYYDGDENTSIAYTWNGTAWELTSGEAPDDKISISDMEADFTLTDTRLVYTGDALKPAVTYTGSAGLVENLDYIVSYSDNTKPGTAVVTIRGTGDYTGSIEKTFTITKADHALVADSSTIQKYVDSEPFVIAANTDDWEDAEVTLTSSDSSVAEVVRDEDGKDTIRPRGAGSTVITIKVAESDCYKAAETTVSLTVLKNNAVLKCLDLNWNLGTNTADDTLNIASRFRYNGTLVSEEPVTLAYESSDPAVVTVDREGVLRGISAGTATISINAPETDAYSKSNTLQVTVTVSDAVAQYGSKSYISVSSALGQVGDLTEATINLLKDTARSEILHLPSDKAVIPKGKTITLDLYGFHYYGSLKIQGKLILKNSVPVATSMLRISSQDESDDNARLAGGSFDLDGGCIVIESDAAANANVQVTGDTASISSADGQLAYYANVKDAIEDANEAVRDENISGVMVTLTDDAILTETVNMDEGVSLNLAGNSLGNAGTDAVLNGSEGSVTSTVNGEEKSAAVAASVISEGLISSAAGSINRVETASLTIPYEVATKQPDHTYDGKAPQLKLTETGDTSGFETRQIESSEVNAGTHTYKVNVLNQGVIIATLSGDVSIIPALVDVSAVTLADARFCPDGEAHNLAVTELPDGVEVAYTDAKTEKGAYTVEATLTADSNHQLIDSGEEKASVKRTAMMTIGHKLTAHAAVDATCEEDGNIAYWTCETCRKYFEDAGADTEIDVSKVVIAKTGHKKDAGKVTAEPTCTEDGIKTYTCEHCHQVLETEVVPATGHNWDNGQITKAASCMEAGVRTYTCRNCGETKTEVIPATGHSIVNDPAVKATPTAAGKTAGTHCSVCGKVITPQTTIAKVAGMTLSVTSYTYNGTAQKPSVMVKDATGKTIAASNYDVNYASGCINAGTYPVVVTFKGGTYSGSLAQAFTITKAVPKLKVKTAKKTYKKAKVKKKKQTFAIGASVTGNGKLTYKISKFKGKAKKYISINKKNGKITVKKGTPKGTYTVTVKVTAKASANYTAKTFTKNIKITVK